MNNKEVTTNQFKQKNFYHMLALDHRSSFKQMMEKSGQKATEKKLIRYKTKILNAVYKQASGVLLDPEIGLQALTAVKNSSEIPYLLSIEKSSYQADPKGIRQTELQYSGKDLKEKGASGIKLLLYINPNLPTEKQNHQLTTAKKAVEEAKKTNLPLFLEIVTYNTEQEPQVEKALSLFLDNKIRPDVFKLQYPGNNEKCKKITRMLKEIPWILLTRGKKFAIFKQELKTAVKAGARGFLAGRALWQELFELHGKDEEIFLNQTLPARFKQLKAVSGG